MARSTPDKGSEPLEALLEASGSGDRQAFAEAYRIAAPRLFAVALRMLRRRDLAEDVLQESFISIWRKAGQYRPERGRPLAWMASIVRNRAIDRLRSDKRKSAALAESRDDAAVVANPGLAEPSIPEHLAASLRGCLERLQINYQRSILLAYYYGLTHEELTQRLGAPLGTVKSWVRRGLLQIKDCLDK